MFSLARFLKSTSIGLTLLLIRGYNDNAAVEVSALRMDYNSLIQGFNRWLNCRNKRGGADDLQGNNDYQGNTNNSGSGTNVTNRNGFDIPKTTWVDVTEHEMERQRIKHKKIASLLSENTSPLDKREVAGFPLKPRMKSGIQPPRTVDEPWSCGDLFQLHDCRLTRGGFNDGRRIKRRRIRKERAEEGDETFLYQHLCLDPRVAFVDPRFHSERCDRIKTVDTNGRTHVRFRCADGDGDLESDGELPETTKLSLDKICRGCQMMRTITKKVLKKKYQEGPLVAIDRQAWREQKEMVRVRTAFADPGDKLVNNRRSKKPFNTHPKTTVVLQREEENEEENQAIEEGPTKSEKDIHVLSVAPRSSLESRQSSVKCEARLQKIPHKDSLESSSRSTGFGGSPKTPVVGKGRKTDLGAARSMQ